MSYTLKVFNVCNS